MFLVPYRQGGAAARISIELRQDGAREIDLFREGLDEIRRFLARHGVHDQQRIRGVDLHNDNIEWKGGERAR